MAPARTLESHIQNGNRALDKRSLQIAGYAGHFEFYQDIETETLEMDAHTVQITTRTFAKDGNARKTLVDLTEESKHILASGDSITMRITSRVDLNGSLQVVRREMAETKTVDKNIEVTNTTLLLPNINGGFAPAVKTQETRKRMANGTLVQSETTSLLDGAGNWQPGEIRQNTSSPEPKSNTEERILRCNTQGNLTEVSRALSTESKNFYQEKQRVLESYSVNLPGTTPDGALHLVERTSSTQRGSAGEQLAEQRVEQRNPGDPQSGLQLFVLINDTMHAGVSGLQATRTIRNRDVNGSFGVVEVDTTNFDKVLTIEVQKAFSANRK